MLNWLKLVFSDPNGVPDDARITAMCAVFTALGLAIYAIVVKGQVFEMQAYGVGIGALYAGVGASFKLRGNA